MLHIKLKGMEHNKRAPCKHIFCPYTHPEPQMESKGHICFQKVIIVHIKLKEMEYRAPCEHIFCPYTYPRPLRWNKKVKTFFSESRHVAYQIKGNGA